MRDLQSWRRQFGPELVGEAPGFVEALRALQRVAECDATIVITGETGTGKDLMARTAHRASARSQRPYVAVNCAALPDSLLEAELFGHVKGGFTGATQARSGRFLSAHGGTLFLDEIGELSLAAQAKLLRVLEDRMVTPVGSDQSVPVDVRVIAATHRDLLEMVREGAFRADLYYRMCVVQIDLPPLREREDDLDLITDVAVAMLAQRYRRPIERLDDSARELLRAHEWPGNVRELWHCLERTVLLAERDVITAADVQLPQGRRSSPRLGTAPGADAEAWTRPGLEPVPVASNTAAVRRIAAPTADLESLDLRAALVAVERALISQALDVARGNRTEAAALLGLNRTTLVEKLRKYGV